MTASDIEIADRLSRKRARMMMVLAVIFVTQQAAYVTGRIEDGARAVDHVKIGAWLVLSIVLLLLLATGGAWLRSKNVRALMEDDVTRANRAEAFRLGFLVTMAAGIGLYCVSLFEPVAGRDAIHILMSTGLVVALIRFGMLERRAFRDG